jgi:hypothetical protein
MLKSLVTISCLLLTLTHWGQVTFLLEQTPANTPPADTLFLAGSMNNWDAGNKDYQFRRDGAGRYFITLSDKTL